MPVTQEDLQKAIEATERELAELKAAQRVMDRLGGFATKSNAKAGSITPAIGESGIINLDEVELPGKREKRGPTLLADIRSVIGRLGSQEFTVSHVDAVLKKMGRGSEAKHFKNRISITIRQLADEGLITLSHKGVGSDPHRYRVAKDGGLENTQARISPRGGTEPEDQARPS